LIYLFAYNFKKGEYEGKLRDYEERIECLIRGHPTEEEAKLYETEIKEIMEKYYREEVSIKIREFIVKRRAESILYLIKKH